MALLLSLCLAPCIAYLFKLAFDWYFQQDIDRYTSQRLRRLSKLHNNIRQPAPGPLPPRQTHHNNALLSLISHIQADFILPWYSRISPSSTFPSAIESLLVHCTDSAVLRFSHVDIPDLCVTRILPKLTEHFDEYRKIEHLLYPTGTFSSSRHHHPSHTVNPAAILQSHHKHLHPALPASTLANPLPSVQAYLGARVVEPLLKALLPKEEQSRAVMALTREVVASCVLLPLVDMLSEPDFWNQMISDKVSGRRGKRDPALDRRVLLPDN
jgi:sorting nexin-25